ncbi:small nuclear ribonucleoprotein Sm D2 isoform 3, partial [Daubentonia madagascariensis]
LPSYLLPPPGIATWCWRM